jgi:ligand-binding sensor domain-containing protein
LYILFLLLLSQQIYGQQAKQYSFKHYGTSSGLAANIVQQVVQDPDGYIWIGTNNGIQRFDGTRYITFRKQKDNPFAIPNNFIHQLLLDKKNNLWVLTDDGKVGVFDIKQFTYKEVMVKVKSPTVLTTSRELVTDEEGNLFLNYLNLEFLTWNEERREFSAAYNFIPEFSQWQIISFTQQPGTQKYWIGWRKGMAIYDKKTNQLSYAGHNTAQEPFIEKMGNITIPGSISFDHTNRVWFVSWARGSSAVYAFDLAKKDIFLDGLGQDVKSYYEVGGVLPQKNGTIWSYGMGVFGQFNEKEKKFYQLPNEYKNEQSIDYSRIKVMYEDREQNIWVGTDNNGLYRFNPSTQFFTNIRQMDRAKDKPSNGSMMSFLLTKQGTLLAGSWGDGLYRVDSNFNTVPLNIKPYVDKTSPTIWGMCYSADSNTIWMGNQPGINRVDANTQTSTYYNPAIMRNRTVRQVAADKYGNVWMGTQSIGLFKWTAANGKKRFEDGVTRFTGVDTISQILKLFIDAKGYVWACTSGFGVYVIDPATDKVIWHFGTNEPAERKILWNGVADALQYDDSTIVIAASGLYFFNTRQQKITKVITMPETLPANIVAMEKDKHGYLWVAMTEGIFRINPRNKIFIHFDRVDGIINDHFINAASYVLPDGRIIFGADNQFVVFDPLKVRINNTAPDVKITGFQLMNKPLLVDSLLQRKQIELSPDDNAVTIEFSGLMFDGTYIIKFKLEGLDKDWRSAQSSSQVVYSYLPPGTYTFLAKSEDAEGNPSKNITSMLIVVNPPFWKTWWFFCLLALLIASIFYWLDKQRVNKLVALQNVRTEIASNLHEEVNQTLNNINLLSEMAKIKADKDIDRSKEFIDQISTKSHNMIIAMDDILWSIDPENDTMEKSLLRMMEFADALKNRHGGSIELALDKKVRDLKLDMKTRHEVFIIFKEALRKIVQYSGGRETLIHIDLFRNKLSMKLQDATASIDKNTAATDNAIKEMSTRSATIAADLDVQYDKNGIAIILLVPVK